MIARLFVYLTSKMESLMEKLIQMIAGKRMHFLLLTILSMSKQDVQSSTSPRTVLAHIKTTKHG